MLSLPHKCHHQRLGLCAPLENYDDHSMTAMTGDDDDYVDNHPKPIHDKYEGSYYLKGPRRFVYVDSDNDSTKQEQIEPELPRPLLLGEQTILATKAQKRYRRENMRNLDAGNKPEVNPSLSQTRQQYRFPRPCGLLDQDGGYASSDGKPITSAETKRWSPRT